MAEADIFDISSLLASLTQSRGEDGFIYITGYLDGYDELIRFFSMLGTVFGFVVSDVKDKVNILRNLQNSDLKEHHDSVNAMLQYDKSLGYTQLKKKSNHGARTLLRLHRALQFVIQFLTALRDTEEENLTTITWDSYNSTLANYHPWIIRKAVGVAVYALPSRTQLVEKMSGKNTVPELMDTFPKLIDVATDVYNTVQELYAKDDLLNLS